MTTPTPVVGVTSATRVTPYISLDMFANQRRRGVSLSTLMPGADQASQNAAVAEYIAEASGMADQFLLGTLAATLDTEAGPVTVNRNGWAVIVPRYRPIIALTAFALGSSPANMTAYGSLSGASPEPTRILVPTGPTGNWMTSQGPLQFGAPAVWPGEMYGRWTTCNGYPVTWLTASIAASAVTINVADTTGIIAGQTQLTIYAGKTRHVFVPTAVSTAGSSGFGTGPGQLTLPTPIAYAVTNNTDYPTYVSALPPDVNEAIALGTRGLIKMTAGGNISSPTTQQTKAADPLGAGNDMAAMYELLDSYQMVQR